jgi:hypothetical protein
MSSMPEALPTHAGRRRLALSGLSMPEAFDFFE